MRSRSSLLLSVSCVAIAVRAVAAQVPQQTIDYANGRLTVSLESAAAAAVLERIAIATGAEVRGDPTGIKPVSSRFEDVPLEIALGRLLGRESFLLVYGTDGSLRAIELLGAGGVFVTRSTVPPAFSEAPAEEPHTLADLLALLDEHEPVAVYGPLKDLLGSDTATFRQLLEIGVNEGDPVVRKVAIRTGLRVLDVEPELRSSVLSVLDRSEPAEIAALLRQAAGARAEELAGYMASESRATGIRIKARETLAVLRTDG